MNAKWITAATILSLAMSSAFAGDWYVAGSIGQSKARDNNKSDTDAELVSIFGVTGVNSSMDDNDTGYKLQFGYKFTPNWALEVGYVDLGKIDYRAGFTDSAVPGGAGSASTETKASGWNIAGVGTYPIDNQFSVFGKLGFIDAKVEQSAAITAVGGSGAASVSATEWKAHWGIGAAYNMTKNWGLRAEWERFNKLGDNDTTGENDVDLLSIGAVFNF